MGGIGIGWYGPLIDISRASSHIGDHVQLLVFLHNSSPVHYKLSNGVEVIRTDIQVGDDTHPFFSVSIWQKDMGSMAFPGAIVFLQNVNDIIGACRTGVQMKEKLRKVIEWINRAGSSIHDASSHRHQHKINWRVDQERVSQDCFSLSQVLRLDKSCKVNFLASVGEIFIPTISRLIHETEDERMFVSRRLFITGDENLAEDLICNGCLLCGSPLDSQSRSTRTDQSTLTLYCQNNYKHLHRISTIYRPFMLYIWDNSNCMPLLVKNKAAELIFGNLKAETVQSCYKRRKHGLNSYSNKGEGKTSNDPNFYLIWLILVKVLVQQGRNSPLKFKVEVDVDRDTESGRFELVSVYYMWLTENLYYQILYKTF